MRPDTQTFKNLRVSYRQLDRLAHEGDGLAHPADILVACYGYVARTRCCPRSRHDARAPLPHGLREALEEALLWLGGRSLFGCCVLVLRHGPARYRSAAPVAPAFVAVWVYFLGEAGQNLGHPIEIQNRAPRARSEVREHPLRKAFFIHIEDTILPHLAEGVPGVLCGVIVVVDVNLLTREELLAPELLGRTPLAGRRTSTLLAQEAPEPLKELVARDRNTVRRVLRGALAPQERSQVIQRAPLLRQRQLDGHPCGAVFALDPVRWVASSD